MALAGVVLAAAPFIVQGGEKPTHPTFTPATTTIYDRDPASGDLLLFRSDHYNGIDKATYTGSISSNAGWGLSLFNQSVRWAWVSLSQPVSGSPANPAPDGFYWEKVEIYSRCWNVNNEESTFPAIPPGTSMNRCSFGLDFLYNRTQYKLVMGPSIPGLAHNTAGTGWATVSCNTTSGTTCNSWTIAPNMTAGGGNVPTVANLYQAARQGPILVGQYYNTYRIDVTIP